MLFGAEHRVMFARTPTIDSGKKSSLLCPKKDRFGEVEEGGRGNTGKFSHKTLTHLAIE